MSRKVAFIPTILIAVVGVLSILGFIGQTLALITQAGLVGFCLGQASVIFAESERDRREAIKHTEAFIAWMDDRLRDDDIPDDRRESGEMALAAAAESLNYLERAASPWRRWRDRRARERAST
jgi:hypothetical protein